MEDVLPFMLGPIWSGICWLIWRFMVKGWKKATQSQLRDNSSQKNGKRVTSLRKELQHLEHYVTRKWKETSCNPGLFAVA